MTTTDTGSPSPRPAPPTAPLGAALFDYDGTLFDTDPVHWDCWNRAMAAFGSGVDRHTYYTSCAGRPSHHIAADLARRAGLAADPLDIVRHKEAAYADWLRSGQVPWMPAAEHAFRRFQQRRLKLAVVTSSARASVTVGLRQRGILGALDALITREDVAHHKPAPHCYQLCIERLGLPPAACVVFEDTTSGVQAAAAAGLRCIAVRPPHAGPQDFAAAERVFTDWTSATDWVLGTADRPHSPAPPA
ncbi:MAG: HAD family phosphatase [Lentisphaerae bacterium]|nr:HAD family phosphatase [Lentisphaerota bacterium]